MSEHCPIASFLKPRWERRKDARPQELLRAALELFVERGFAATRLDDVAKMAGVSKGTLYLYYKSKEDLFKAVVRDSIVPLIGEAEGIIEEFEGDSESLFRLIMTTWWERVGKSNLSGLSKLMMAEACNFPDLAQFYHDEVVSRGDRMFITMIKRGVARGEMRDVDLEITPRLLIAPVIMMMMWKHSYSVCQVDPNKLDNYMEHFIDLALRGLLVHPPKSVHP
jgi:AcrR family transcriptional regulator